MKSRKSISVIVAIIMILGVSLFPFCYAESGDQGIENNIADLSFQDDEGVSYSRVINNNVVTSTSVDTDGFAVICVIDLDTMETTVTYSGDGIQQVTYTTNSEATPSLRGVTTQTGNGKWYYEHETRGTNNYLYFRVPNNPTFVTPGIIYNAGSTERSIYNKAQVFKDNIISYNDLAIQDAFDLVGLKMPLLSDVTTVLNFWEETALRDLSTSQQYEIILNTWVVGIIGRIAIPINLLTTGIVMLGLQSNRNIYGEIKILCNNL